MNNAAKFLLKVWWCYIWRWHKWTSKAQRGEFDSLPENTTIEEAKEVFSENTKMYCERCGHVSEVWARFENKF